MRLLTLIRHAKSDWSDAALSDFERPLNSRGKKNAPLMGQRMVQNGTIPDLLISSSAKRARKTASLIAREIGIAKAEIRLEEQLFDAKERTLQAFIKGLPEKQHIGLIGHNPGLSELATWLCKDAPEWLPTCAVLTLELNIDSWDELKKGCGQVKNYDYPKKAD